VLFWMIAKDLLGLSLLDILYDFIQVRTRAEGVPHRPKFQRIKLACYASIALLLTWQSWWVAALLYWAVPVLTWYKCGVQLRALCNHFGMQETASPYSGTRTLITSWWERLLICPYYASHHLDHHLYPSVPCYNLWALHRELLEHSEYRQHAHITRGFWGLLKELADGPARYEVRPTF